MTVYEQGMEIIRACRKVGPLGLSKETLSASMARRFNLDPEVTLALVEFAVRLGKVRKVADRYIATGY